MKNISNYLAENIKNENQKKRIIVIANNLNLYNDFDTFKNLNDYIYTILLLSLQNSKETDLKNNTINTIDDTNYPSYGKQEPVSCDLGFINNYQLITGEENIINAAISLLNSIPVKPDYINESILITFFSELHSFSKFEQTYIEWNNVLLDVQKKGWNINKVICIDDNKKRNMKIMYELLNNITSKNYYPYYLNKYETLLHYKEMILIPTIGVLVTFFSKKSGKMDNAFLFKDMKSLEAFEDTFDLYYTNLTPLIENKAAILNTNLLSNFTTYGKLNGNRYSYNNYFNFLSIPPELYNKLLLMYNKKITNKRLSDIIETRKMLDEQIRNYKFIEIYSKDSIEQLIKISNQPNAHLSSHDIYIIIENIIAMLEKYDNYNIALINSNKTNIFYNFSWVIKDLNAVLINNFHHNVKNNEKVCISITEPSIINFTTKYFMEILDEIAPINKEKETVISWFKTQIKYLKI